MNPIFAAALGVVAGFVLALALKITDRLRSRWCVQCGLLVGNHCAACIDRGLRAADPSIYITGAAATRLLRDSHG